MDWLTPTFNLQIKTSENGWERDHFTSEIVRESPRSVSGLLPCKMNLDINLLPVSKLATPAHLRLHTPVRRTTQQLGSQRAGSQQT